VCAGHVAIQFGIDGLVVAQNADIIAGPVDAFADRQFNDLKVISAN